MNEIFCAVPAASALPDDVSPLHIATISDLHLPNDSASARVILENAPFWKRTDYVVLLGDMVATYGTPREYQAVEKWVRALPKPYSAINGNHEFYFHVGTDSPRYGAVWQEGSPTEKSAQLQFFLDFYGLQSLWRAQHLKLGSFVFLGLNDTEEHKPESLTSETWQFLDAQLQIAPEKPAFIFCHAPLLIDKRLDMTYYDDERTACVHLPNRVLETIAQRRAPIFWMSGHIHLHPEHYLSAPYEIAPQVWQVHCPDSWGYSRWQREHVVPQRHSGVYSRTLQIEESRVVFTSHDHQKRENVSENIIQFGRK